MLYDYKTKFCNIILELKLGKISEGNSKDR